MLRILSNLPAPFERPHGTWLAGHLAEPHRFLQVVARPPHVGKSMLVQRVVEGAAQPHRIASADEPAFPGPEWVAQQ